MTDSPRDRFLKRLSSVGSGLREDIQLALAVIVSDLRDQVIGGRQPDEDVGVMVALHDKVEALWRNTLRSNPPLSPEEIAARLTELRDGCAGPVAGFRVQLDVVVQKARALEDAKKRR